MRRSLGPLLCELHAHTRWSDGELTVAELVDLHGRSGFDVLCVTDHVVRSDDPWREQEGLRFTSIEEATFPLYLAEVEREGERAWRTYAMLVVPGLELTFNDDEPVMAAHAVAIGLREFVSVDGGIAEAMRSADEAGAAIVAAHPNADEPAPQRGRLTRRFSQRRGAARARSPLRALQPLAAVPLDRRRRAPRGGVRRLPPSGAPPWVENPASEPPRRRGRRRVPPLAPSRLSHKPRRRAVTRRRLNER